MAIDINIPSQVKNYANLAAFPATGSLKTIFIAEDTNKTYRWTGSAYVEISASQATAWGTITGTLSAQTDLNTALSGKVPTSRTLTINGTTQDLSADRTFTISTGITIGTTAITSGTVGRVLFEGTGNVVQESANLFWDNTNGRLGIGTSSPASKVDILQVADNTSPTLLRLNNTGSGASTGATLEFPFGAFIRSSFASMILSDRSGATLTLQGTSLTSSATNFSLAGAGIITFTGGSGTDGMIRTGGTITFNSFSGSYRDVGKFFQTGNFLIQTGGTFTDAGFKLDVNGTARVSGALTIGTGTAVASSISYGATYGVTIYGNTGSNSDLLLTDRGGNLRFRIVNGGNILQTSSVINDISIGTTAVAKSIIADATYGMTVRGGVGSIYNLSLVENTGTNGLFIDSSGNAKVGVYNSTYNTSAILEAVSTTKGFLPPRQTQAQRTAIASPAVGLQVYQTDGVEGLYIYKSTGWALLL